MKFKPGDKVIAHGHIYGITNQDAGIMEVIKHDKVGLSLRVSEDYARLNGCRREQIAWNPEGNFSLVEAYDSIVGDELLRNVKL